MTNLVEKLISFFRSLSVKPEACSLKRKRGFTLIEVLVVLVIMGFFVAMMAKVFTKQDDQRRFDETRVRMEEIKKAILGSKGAYANGQRQFSGYVADMGSLPALIDVDPGPGVNLQPVGLWTDQSPPLPVALPGWGFQSISRIWMGWRGPYLEVPPQGDNILRDGWGNLFVFLVVGTDITITSPGANGVINPADTGFDEDIAMRIKQNEYEAPVAGRVNLGIVAPVNARVKIYFSRMDGVDEDGDASDLAESRTIAGVTADGYFRYEQGAAGVGTDGTSNIGIGLRSIYAYDVGSLPANPQPQIFTVEPTGNWLGDIEIQ